MKIRVKINNLCLAFYNFIFLNSVILLFSAKQGSLSVRFQVIYKISDSHKLTRMWSSQRGHSESGTEGIEEGATWSLSEKF